MSDGTRGPETKNNQCQHFALTRVSNSEANEHQFFTTPAAHSTASMEPVGAPAGPASLKPCDPGPAGQRGPARGGAGAGSPREAPPLPRLSPAAPQRGGRPRLGGPLSPASRLACGFSSLFCVVRRWSDEISCQTRVTDLSEKPTAKRSKI